MTNGFQPYLSVQHDKVWIDSVVLWLIHVEDRLGRRHVMHNAFRMGFFSVYTLCAHKRSSLVSSPAILPRSRLLIANSSDNLCIQVTGVVVTSSSPHTQRYITYDKSNLLCFKRHQVIQRLPVHSQRIARKRHKRVALHVGNQPALPIYTHHAIVNSSRHNVGSLDDYWVDNRDVVQNFALCGASKATCAALIML